MAINSLTRFLWRRTRVSFRSCNQTLFLLRSTSFSSVAQSRAEIGEKPRPNNGDFRGEEDIVIVGAGIGGLATAIALQRAGIRSRVLEQAQALRTGGTALTLSQNGWKVLDAIGIGNNVRNQFLRIQGISLKSADGRELRSFSLDKDDPSQELRAVERKALLESLANELPPDTISFSSGLSKIEKQENGEASLELEDGSQLSAKIVIACDGVHSPVAKWMGFREPKYAGHLCFRGIAYYPKGQPFDPKVHYTYGRGARAVFLPITDNKIYWSVICNSSLPDSNRFDPLVLRQEAEETVRSWLPEFVDIINHTSDETLVQNPLYDRWLWPVISPSAYTGNIVLVGDAWHPMTPNLGQGACCALEDSLVLSKKLAEVIKFDNITVEEAFREYERERWARIFQMTIRANLVGAFLQWDNPLVCYVRDNVIVPKLGEVKSISKHTNFES